MLRRCPLPFRMALRALPTHFYRNFGSEIRQIAQARADRLPPGSARAHFWLRETVDLLRTALELRLRPGAGGTSTPPAAKAARPTSWGGLSTREAHPRGGSGTPFQGFYAGLRLLNRRPATTGMILVTLALGMGVCITMFQLAHSAFWKPLPVEQQDRLVRMRLSWTSGAEGRASGWDFLQYRKDTETFASLAASGCTALNLTVADAGRTHRITATQVTHNFFATLGVRPLLGRTFGRPEREPGGEFAVMLSYPYWEQRFGSEAEVVGTSLRLNGREYRILGVMPKDFLLPHGSEVWIPFAEDNLGRGPRRFFFLEPIGRLQEGVRLEVADLRVKRIAQRLETQSASADVGLVPELIPLRQEVVREACLPLLLLSAGALALLLIACGNTASLLLARAAERQQEIVVRSVLGAGRARILAPFIWESLWLSLLASALALGLAQGALGLLQSWVPSEYRYLTLEASPVPRLLFSTVLCLLCPLFFGVLPALRSVRWTPLQTLKPGWKSDPRKSLRHRRWLVIGQITFCSVLLIAAALLLQSRLHLSAIDPGFDPQNTVALWLHLPQDRSPSAQIPPANPLPEILAKARALPGVNSAAAISRLPMTTQASTYLYQPGAPPGDLESRTIAQVRWSTGNYFSTMGIPLLAGRPFRDDEALGEPYPVVINRTLALEEFAGLPLPKVVGRSLLVDLGQPTETFVVAVVEDVRELGLDASPPATFYLPWRGDLLHPTLILRTEGDPEQLREPLNAIIDRLEPRMPPCYLSSLRHLPRRSIADVTFRAMVLSLIAGMALLLAAVGLNGVLVTYVGQRMHEVSVRMALGANRRVIFHRVLREGLAVTLPGILLGVVIAAYATEPLSSLLFGVAAFDPLTFAVSALLLMAVALVAGVQPALRATRIHPGQAFRTE